VDGLSVGDARQTVQFCAWLLINRQRSRTRHCGKVRIRGEGEGECTLSASRRIVGDGSAEALLDQIAVLLPFGAQTLAKKGPPVRPSARSIPAYFTKYVPRKR